MHNKPAGKITIQEICERAEVNRSTSYFYYTNQCELLYEIQNKLIGRSEQFPLKWKTKPLVVAENYSKRPFLFSYIVKMFHISIFQSDRRRF